jgi:uncharacterized membrane protein
MRPLTIFLSRLLGLFTLIFSLSMALHRQASVQTLTELIRDPTLLFILGLIALVCGLAMVLAHNIWSGGALPIIVTLFGWSILIRGLLLLSLSPRTLADLFEALHFEELFYLYMTIAGILGLYLTVMGFRRTRP